MSELGESEAVSQAVSVRQSVIRAVSAPLGFFVLALLIVEGFLFGAGTSFGLTEIWRVIALGVGVSLFLIVIALVGWLVVKHPQNLVFSEQSHLQVEAMKVFGSENNQISAGDLKRLPPSATPEPPTGQIPPPRTES
jgi:hypothetical protein